MRKSPFKQCKDCPLYAKTTSVSTNNERPSFSIKHLQDGFDLNNCTEKEQIEFLKTLHKHSRMTWQELTNAPRHGLGCEIISHDSIKAAIPAIVKPDTKLLAFRFFGKAPFVGFREGEIFHIIWIDRAFTLYNHG